MDWHTRRDSLTVDELRPFVTAHWHADPTTLTIINRGVNVVLRFANVTGRGLYLRVAHPMIRTRAETDAAYAYLSHLAAAYVAVCVPVPATDGRLIVPLGRDDFYATVVSEVPGQPMALDITDMDVFAAWGRSLGQLHAAAAEYIPADGIAYPTFHRFWENVRPIVPQARVAIQQIYAELDAWMKTLPADDILLTHGDYRPGNVIWDGKTAWAVDFDEPVYNWAITDVARALLEYSTHPPALRAQIKAAFLRGYRTQRALDDTWVDLLPEFMQLRGTIMHLWDVQGLADDGINTRTDWAVEWALKQVEW